MGPVSLEELREFTSELEGKTLLTRFRGHPFTLHITLEGFEYTPQATGIRRRQAWRYAERVLNRYNERRSLHPVDYHDISINASYFLAVLGAYLESATTATRG